MSMTTARVGLAVLFTILSAVGAFAAPPANDNCANPTGITLGANYVGNTTEATNDGPGGCGSAAGSPDVWYQLTVNTGGLYTISTCGSSYYTVVALLQNGCPATQEKVLACATQSLECGTGGRLEVVLDPGIYLVYIAGVDDTTGNYTLRVDGPRINDSAAPVACPQLFTLVAGAETDKLFTQSPGADDSKLIGPLGATYYPFGLVRMRSTGAIYTVGVHPNSDPISYDLLTIDPSTGAATGAVGLDRTNIYVQDLAERPSDGKLFAMVIGDIDSLVVNLLVSIDPATGHVTQIPGPGVTSAFGAGGGFTIGPDGTFYYASDRNVKTISPTTGETLSTTELHYFLPTGLLSRPVIVSLETDPQSGAIWAAVADFVGAPEQFLCTLDPATGNVAYRGTLPQGTRGIAFFCRCSEPSPAAAVYPADGAGDVGVAELNAFGADARPFTDEMKVTFKWAPPSVSGGAGAKAAEPAAGGPDPGPMGLPVGGYGVFWNKSDVNELSALAASGSEVADDFFVNRPAILTGIRTWIYDSGNWDGTVRYAIYRDEGGKPAATPIASGVPSGGVTKLPFGSLTFSIEFALDSPVPLDPGTYWMGYNLNAGCVGDTSVGVMTDLNGPLLEPAFLRDGCAGEWVRGGADLTQQLIGYTDDCSRTTFDLYLDMVDPPAQKIGQNLSVPVYAHNAALEPGTTYYWRIVSKDPVGDTPGPVWSFSTFTPEPNDRCENARLIWPAVDRVINNTRALTQPGTACGRRDLWFSYTPSASGTAAFNICQDFNASIAVYLGCPSNEGTLIECGTNGSGTTCETLFGNDLSVPVAVGQTYLIQVGGLGTGLHGDLNLKFTGPTPLYNGRPYGDFDNSGCTDLADFLILLDNWLLDLNGEVVGLGDFLNLLDYWQLGPNC